MPGDYPARLARSLVLSDYQKRYFEKVVIYCDQYASLIPVSFVLGACVLLGMRVEGPCRSP